MGIVRTLAKCGVKQAKAAVARVEKEKAESLRRAFMAAEGLRLKKMAGDTPGNENEGGGSKGDRKRVVYQKRRKYRVIAEVR